VSFNATQHIELARAIMNYKQVELERTKECNFAISGRSDWAVSGQCVCSRGRSAW
jgi:Tfp pilus assembly ATPase PilU